MEGTPAHKAQQVRSQFNPAAVVFSPSVINRQRQQEGDKVHQEDEQVGPAMMGPLFDEHGNPVDIERLQHMFFQNVAAGMYPPTFADPGYTPAPALADPGSYSPRLEETMGTCNETAQPSEPGQENVDDFQYPIIRDGVLQGYSRDGTQTSTNFLEHADETKGLSISGDSFGIFGNHPNFTPVVLPPRHHRGADDFSLPGNPTLKISPRGTTSTDLIARRPDTQAGQDDVHLKSYGGNSSNLTGGAFVDQLAPARTLPPSTRSQAALDQLRAEVQVGAVNIAPQQPSMRPYAQYYPGLPMLPEQSIFQQPHQPVHPTAKPRQVHIQNRGRYRRRSDQGPEPSAADIYPEDFNENVTMSSSGTSAQHRLSVVPFFATQQARNLAAGSNMQSQLAQAQQFVQRGYISPGPPSSVQHGYVLPEAQWSTQPSAFRPTGFEVEDQAVTSKRQTQRNHLQQVRLRQTQQSLPQLSPRTESSWTQQNVRHAIEASPFAQSIGRTSIGDLNGYGITIGIGKGSEWKPPFKEEGAEFRPPSEGASLKDIWNKPEKSLKTKPGTDFLRNESFWVNRRDANAQVWEQLSGVDSTTITLEPLTMAPPVHKTTGNTNPAGLRENADPHWLKAEMEKLRSPIPQLLPDPKIWGEDVLAKKPSSTDWFPRSRQRSQAPSNQSTPKAAQAAVARVCPTGGALCFEQYRSQESH
jgi:hypothetical protein